MQERFPQPWIILSAAACSLAIGIVMHRIAGREAVPIHFTFDNVVRSGLYGPALEEVLFGWVMAVFFTLVGIHLGLPLWIAVGAGSVATLPYFILGHDIDRWDAVLIFAVHRLVFTATLVLFGFVPAVAAHGVNNVYFSVINAIAARRQSKGNHR